MISIAMVFDSYYPNLNLSYKTIIIIFFSTPLLILIKIVVKEFSHKNAVNINKAVLPEKSKVTNDYHRDIFMGVFVLLLVSLLTHVFRNLIAFYPTSPEYKLSIITFLPGLLFASYFFDQAYEKYKSQR